MRTAVSYLTAQDGSLCLEKRESIRLTAGGGADLAVEIDESIRHQEFLGLGFSLDETSVYNYHQLTAENRAAVLDEFFNPQKMNCSVIRICLGSSDMTGVPYYSYDDMPRGQSDPELKRFSIQKDIDLNIILTIKQILAINPEVKIFASVWSPPGWMKINDSILGIRGYDAGCLRSFCVEVYADYLYKAVAAYKEQGVPIFGINPINEPNWHNNVYPQCYIPAEQEGVIVRRLHKLFTQNGIDTHILIQDADFGYTEDWAAIELADPEVNPLVWGVAFHPYYGSPSVMLDLKKQYPDKHMIFTERSWETGSEGEIIGGIAEAVDLLYNGAETYIDWVNFSDDDRMPILGPFHCTGWVTAPHGNINNWRWRFEKFLYEHISRFIRRGAARLESRGGIKHAAFKNPDGSVAMVAVNTSGEEKSLDIAIGGEHLAAQLPPKSVATFLIG